MNFLYRNGSVFLENEENDTYVKIGKSGFLGSLSISITGKWNIQIRRSGFGLKIYGFNGKDGNIMRNLNINYLGESYITKVNELASVTRGEANAEATIIGKNGTIGKLSRKNTDILIAVENEDTLGVMLVYVALVGYFDKSIVQNLNPFPSPLRIVSNILFIIALAFLLFFNPGLLGSNGLLYSFIIILGLVLVAYYMRTVPPVIPKEKP